eukprot:scaffold128180_cov16-Tisochrysis_lutea.AAC.1
MQGAMSHGTSSRSLNASCASDSEPDLEACLCVGASGKGWVCRGAGECALVRLFWLSLLPMKSAALK